MHDFFSLLFELKMTTFWCQSWFGSIKIVFVGYNSQLLYIVITRQLLTIFKCMKDCRKNSFLPYNMKMAMYFSCDMRECFLFLYAFIWEGKTKSCNLLFLSLICKQVYKAALLMPSNLFFGVGLETSQFDLNFPLHGLSLTNHYEDVFDSTMIFKLEFHSFTNLESTQVWILLSLILGKGIGASVDCRRSLWSNLIKVGSHFQFYETGLHQSLT